MVSFPLCRRPHITLCDCVTCTPRAKIAPPAAGCAESATPGTGNSKLRIDGQPAVKSQQGILVIDPVLAHAACCIPAIRIIYLNRTILQRSEVPGSRNAALPVRAVGSLRMSCQARGAPDWSTRLRVPATMWHSSTRSPRGTQSRTTTATATAQVSQPARSGVCACYGAG